MDQTFMHLLLSEFMGTALMIIFGVGVHCDDVLKKTKYAGTGHLFAITTWAFGITVTLFIFGGVSINPAMALAKVVLGVLPAEQFIPVAIAEFLGAFAGAVFYVATAVNISRLKLVGYFITSFIFGVIGAPLLGSYFSKWTGYSDRPLDALGAVIVAAIAIKLLTFVNSQDLGSLFGILSRLRGGGASNGNK